MKNSQNIYFNDILWCLIIPFCFILFLKELGCNSLIVFLIPNRVITYSLNNIELEYFKLLTAQRIMQGNISGLRKTIKQAHLSIIF